MRSKTTLLTAGAVGFALVAASAPVGARPALHDVTYIMNPNVAVSEGAGSVEIAVRRLQHGTEPAEIDYSTAPIDAGAGDFDQKSGTFTIGGDDTQQVFVPVIDDAETEDIERFRFSLDAARGGPNTILRYPTEAVVSIVDDDGQARISFGTDAYSTFENRGALSVTLVRSGSGIDAEASVTVRSVDGTAAAGSDYEAVDQIVTFAPNAIQRTVQIRLTNDSSGEGTESLALELSTPTGADLAAPSSATVEILDDDDQTSDTVGPVSQFHLPQHGRRYSAAVAREIHLFSSDDASGVAAMWLALRRKMRSGKCAWWTGSRFKAGPCSQKRWKDLGRLPQNYFVVYRLKKRLKPTTRKTGIATYTVYGRARDEAGNLERRLEKGRNKNTYKIRP